MAFPLENRYTVIAVKSIIIKGFNEYLDEKTRIISSRQLHSEIESTFLQHKKKTPKYTKINCRSFPITLHIAPIFNRINQ